MLAEDGRGMWLHSLWAESVRPPQAGPPIQSDFSGQVSHHELQTPLMAPRTPCRCVQSARMARSAATRLALDARR